MPNLHKRTIHSSIIHHPNPNPSTTTTTTQCTLPLLLLLPRRPTCPSPMFSWSTRAPLNVVTAVTAVSMPTRALSTPIRESEKRSLLTVSLRSIYYIHPPTHPSPSLWTFLSACISHTTHIPSSQSLPSCSSSYRYLLSIFDHLNPKPHSRTLKLSSPAPRPTTRTPGLVHAFRFYIYIFVNLRRANTW